ncbi:MAG: cysteine desulfurase-like protein [Jatrophihabitantaceae bacterium]
MSYDVDAIRTHFPALSRGVAHFDGPGGSQVPDVVADAIRDALVSPMANRGRVTEAERHSDDLVADCRRALADLLNADPRGIVFGRSMTQLTFDLSRALAKTWSHGDEVVVSRLDHDANVRPWAYAAEAAGATLRWVDFDTDTGELELAAVAEVLTEHTRLVAVTGASNLIGTRPDLAGIGRLAHDVGALCYVDGVHLVPHAAVDMTAFDPDFFACSPYKFFGPHCGVLAGRPAVLDGLTPDKLVPSSDEIPERFELGTLPYELMAGTTAAVDFLAAIASNAGSRRERLVESMAAVEEYEDGLRRRIEDGLRQLPGLTLWSRAAHRTPTLLITFERQSAADAYRFLAELGVNAPAGSFYAPETSRQLGLGDQGGLRIGLAPYSTVEDADRLLAGLAKFLRNS